jgi:hypothetical protein
MKIIQGLKQIKDLLKKAEDIRLKVAQHCADLDCEVPIYPDQRGQIAQWLQAHQDITKEIASLRFRIQKTNVMTPVTITLGGVHVTKSINEWISRRKDLANLDMLCFKGLSDKGIKEVYAHKLTPNSPESTVKRRMYFDAAERDRKCELYRSEPSSIDATLEITNAVVDLLD